MSPPLDHSKLLFPTAHTSLNSTLTSLKRKDLSISNRLYSITSDAAFVEKVAATYQLPLIANERCGSWYVRPELKAGSAYFKSTDGHHGQWSFSLRRLNLQVLDVIGRDGGCIIVDSTRKGKSMPDALSKTVPIWIAVLNRLLFPEDIEAGKLRTPKEVVSRSEHASIEDRIPAFVAEAQSLLLDKYSPRESLKGKPLKPLWVTPDTELAGSIQRSASRNLVVLCTASGRTSSEQSIANYVQGAADDSESWALGLEAVSFWKHHQQLLATSEDELPDLIKTLTNESKLSSQMRQPVLIKPTSYLWIADKASAVSNSSDFDIMISCSEKPLQISEHERAGRYIHLHCTTGKIGSRELRAELGKLQPLLPRMSSETKILVTCQTGRDLAVGVALAILCLCCSEDGIFQPASSRPPSVPLNKALIKRRLSWIIVSMPDAAPSRATLQSVNAFLLG